MDEDMMDMALDMAEAGLNVMITAGGIAVLTNVEVAALIAESE